MRDAGEAGGADSTSGKRPARTRPTRGAVRERILEAAGRAFAERGFEAASLDEIAQAAGFTKGAIYSNFRTKDDLILALMDDQVTDRLASSADALRRDDLALADRVRLVGDQLTQALLVEQSWHSLFLEFWQRALRDEALAARLAGRRQALRRAIAQVIDEQADQAGVTFPLPSSELATVILALSNGLAVERYPDPAAVPEDLFGRVLSLLLVGSTNDGPAG